MAHVPDEVVAQVKGRASNSPSAPSEAARRAKRGAATHRRGYQGPAPSSTGTVAAASIGVSKPAIAAASGRASCMSEDTLA